MNQQDRLAPPSAAAAARLGQPSQESSRRSRSGGEDTRLGPRPAEAKQTNTNLHRTLKMTTTQRGNRCRDNFLLKLSLFIVLQIILLTTSGHQYFSRQPETQTIRRGLASAQFLFTYEINQESDDSRAPKSSLFDPSSFKIVTPSQLASSYQKLASQLPEQAPQTPGSSQSFLQEAQQQQQQPVAASPATPTGESLATPSNPSSSFLKQTSAAIQSFAELFHLTPSSSPAPLGGAAAVSPPQQAAASTSGLDQQAEARSLHEHWTQQQQRAHQPNHHHLAAAFQSFTTSPSVVQQQPSSQASIGQTSNQQPSSQASYWLTSNPLSGPDGNFLVEIKSNSNQQQQQASNTQSELQPPGGHLVDNLLSLSHPGQQNQQQNNHLQHLHNQQQQQPTPTTTVSSLRESRPSGASAQSSFLATPTSYYPAPKPALQAAPTPVSTPVVPTTTTTTSTTTTTAQQQVQQAQQNFNHPHQQKHFQPQTQALHQHQARSLQQQQQHRQPQQTHARLSSNSFRPSELLEGGHQLQPPANAPEHFGGGGNSYTPSPSAHHHQHNHLKSAEESLIAFRQQQQDQAVSAPQEPRGNSLLAGDDEPAPLPVTPQSSHRHAHHHHHQHSDPLSESQQQQPPRASGGLTLTKPAHHTNTYSVVPQQQHSKPQPTAHEIPKVSPQIYESFLLQQKDQYEKHMELLKQQQELNKLLEQKQKREREREREGSEERGKKLAQQQRKKEELERQEQRKKAAAREQEQAQAARKARLERQQQQQQQEAEEAARRKLARQRQEEEEQRRYRELVEAREREEKLRAQAEAEALAARRQREQQEREAAETRRRQEEAAREEEAAKQEAAKQYRAYLRQQEELKKLLELKQKEDEAAEARRRQVAAAEKEKEQQQQAAAAVSRSRSTSAARANKLALEHKERARQQQQQATNAQAIQRQSAQQARGETTTWGGRATRARPIAAELPSGNLLTPTSATAATPANEPEVTSALYSPSSSTQAASTATATSTQRPPESTTGVARVGARLPAANTRQAAEPMRRLRADEKLIRQKIPLYSGAGKYGLYSKADSDELAKLLEAVNLPTSASSTTTTTTTTTSTTTTTTPAPVTSSSLQDDEAARDTATERALYASRMASTSLSPLLNLRELSVTPSSLQVSGGGGGGRAAPTGEPFSSTTIFDDDVPRRRVVVRARPAQSSSSQSRGPLSFNISPAASQTSSTRVNSAAAVALSHRSGQSATPPPSAPSRNATHQGANGRAASIGLASLPADSDNDGIPGRAGHEYPVLAEVPQTSFSCSKQPLNGYYADTETACQVVHLCQGGQQSSILCPNGTIFNQEKFSCQWWYEVNCARAPMFYQLNDNLYKAAAAVASGDSTPKLDDLRRSSSSGGGGGSNRSQL